MSVDATRRRLSGVLAGVVGWGVGLSCLASTPASGAPGIDVRRLDVSRQDGALVLSVAVRPTLGRSIEEVLQRGIPLYFEAQATLYRPRWYWRDERLARVSRTWRLAYQPLTSSWRVSQGGALHQTVATLDEALTMASRITDWRVSDADAVAPGDKSYIEFSYRLDNSQLPRPMQIDLVTMGDWQLEVERTVRVDPGRDTP